MQQTLFLLCPGFLCSLFCIKIEEKAIALELKIIPICIFNHLGALLAEEGISAVICEKREDLENFYPPTSSMT